MRAGSEKGDQPKVVAEIDGVKFYRIREATVDDPIVDWFAEENTLEPCLHIRLRSGTTLHAPIPHPKLREAGIVSVTSYPRSPSIPVVSTDPNDDDSTLTDRKDIVELVVSWAEDYLRRQRQR